MKNVNYKFVWFLILVFFCFGVDGQSVSKLEADEIKVNSDKAEYEVYATVINEMVESKSVKKIVIRLLTGLDEGGIELFSLPEMEKDFYTKNAQKYKLEKSLFPQRGKIVLPTDEEINLLGSADCNDFWRAFYRKYSGVDIDFNALYKNNKKAKQMLKNIEKITSTGLIEFSRVGFNKERNVAVVYFERQSLCLAGEGLLIKLVKENSVWKVTDKRRLWIS